jgi:hypothetical protein
MSLKEAIRAMQTEQHIQSTLCKVVAVDGLLCDCEPINGDADILEVRLNASGLNGYVITPKVGSMVMVTKFERFEAFISSFSDVEKIEILCDNIVFNDGTNDGMVLINALVNKLNALENKVNSIINTFNTHTHSGVTTGGGTSGTTPTVISGTLTPTQKSDIENTKIKQ